MPRSVEHGASLLADPTRASESAIKKLIIKYPLDRFLIKNFIAYFPEEGVLQIAPQLWQELRHYEVIDVLKSVDEQIRYYIDRHTKKSGRTRFY